MSKHRHRLRAAVCASLSLPFLFTLGCSDAGTITAGNPTNLAKGNWQISSSATAAAKLPVLSGELTTQAGVISGIFHTQSLAACVAPSASFDLSGAADANNAVSLTGSVGGGTLTLTGTLAADGRSLTDAAYTVVGGSCAFAQKVSATAEAFAAVTGTYAGPFTDTDGRVAQVTADLSQSSTPDANGNFTLQGTATVPANPCFSTSVPISSTQVTGGTFTFTYSSNGSSVTAKGTFSSDAKTLTVTSWTASGSCGADTGVPSTMTRQGS